MDKETAEASAESINRDRSGQDRSVVAARKGSKGDSDTRVEDLPRTWVGG